MQNYNATQLSHNIPLDQSPLTIHPVPTLDILDKLSSHVKKRIMSSSPLPTGSENAMAQQQGNKGTKRSKKDATAGDSEPSCSGISKDEEKTKASEKHVHKPDILTSILNEKKASLVRDPEVIAFLKKFNQELQRGRLQK